MKTPDGVALDVCARKGWPASKSTWFYKKRFHDLFGFIDVVAIQPGLPGCLAIQATTPTNISHRRRKILGLEDARRWLEANNRIEIWAVRDGLLVKRIEICPDEFRP